MFHFARLSALKNLSLKRVTLTALGLGVIAACGALFTTQASAQDYYGGRRYHRRPIVDHYCPYDSGYRQPRRYYGGDYGVGRGFGSGYGRGYGGYGGGLYGGRRAIAPRLAPRLAPRIGLHPHGRRPRIGLYLGF